MRLGATQHNSRGRPLVLLGVLSGSSARQRLLRCTWMRSVGFGVRIVFVVGRDAKPIVAAGGGVEVLVANVSEARHRSYLDRARASVTGSFTAYFKLVAFLQYAAAQPEPFVVRADDDVFLSPRMLHVYASWVQRKMSTGLVYGGVFEWYSWRTATQLATCYGYAWAIAEARARQPWRNCSATLFAVGDDGAGRCQGPIPFAKGPFVLLSRSAVEWLVRSPRFERDVRRARALSELSGAEADRRGHRVDDDVQLGYWMAHAPGLTYLRLRRQVAGAGGGDTNLLATHKAPWEIYAPLAGVVDFSWRSAAEVEVRSACEESAPCSTCAVSGARTCIVEARLLLPESARGRVPRCVADAKATGCPAFRDGSEPSATVACFSTL